MEFPYSADKHSLEGDFLLSWPIQTDAEGSNRRVANSPCGWLRARSVTPVSAFVSASEMPGRLAFEGSVIMPVSVPVELCAHAARDQNNNAVPKENSP